MGRAAAVHGGDVRHGHAGGQRRALIEVGRAGGVGDGGAAGGVIGAQRHVLDVNILAEVVSAHLGNGDLLGGDGLHAGLDHLHGGVLHLGYAAIRIHGAGDLHDVADLIVGVIRIVIHLETVDLAVDNILQNDGVDAGLVVIGAAVVVHHLTDHGDILRLRGDGAGLLHGDGAGGDHVVGDGVKNVAVRGDLACHRGAQLQFVEIPNSGGDVYLVAHGEGPLAVHLLHGRLEDLNGLALGVLHGDVGSGEAAVFVVDVGDLHIRQLHIGADVSVSDGADGGGLGGQGEAGGLHIGALGELGLAFVIAPCAGAHDGVA